MRAVLWDLLLLCLCARARGDCRDDCAHCDRLLYRDSFDVLICVLECEGQAVPRATWELCAATGRSAPRPRHPSAQRRAPSEPVAPGAFPNRGREEEEEEEEDVWREGRAAKGVQKRYGGFIGVRKSARKWNNQKRFSEFLKQYLGMAPRSTFRRRFPTRQRQN
ncbi:LOW QUALITY PROTEIN: prepronociceptin [Acridotheres tristis]